MLSPSGYGGSLGIGASSRGNQLLEIAGVRFESESENRL
jgi:hypothetical protein